MALANCLLSAGHNLGCSTIGGLSEIYLGNFDASTTWLETTGEITGVTGSAPTVYKFEQDIEFAGLSQPGQFARENGTVFYETSLSLKFIDMNLELLNTIKALGKAPMFAIVKTNSGQYFLAGRVSPGRASEGQISAGTAMGDLNGAELTIMFKSPDGVDAFDGALLGAGVTVA